LAVNGFITISRPGHHSISFPFQQNGFPSDISIRQPSVTERRQISALDPPVNISITGGKIFPKLLKYFSAWLSYDKKMK